MMKIRSVNYKGSLFRWIAGLFMFLNLFALSGTANVISSVKLKSYATEEKIISRNRNNSNKIFYKSVVHKANWIYSKILSIKSVFERLLINKDNTVHIQFASNSLLALFINFLLGAFSAAIFLFYPESHKTSLPA